MEKYSSNKYCNPYGQLGPFIHVPIVLFPIIFGLVIVYASFFIITDLTNAVSAFILGLSGIVVFSNLAAGWFITPDCITLYNDHLIARGHFWQKWRFDYTDIHYIETVYKNPWWGAPGYATFFYSRNGKKLTVFQQKFWSWVVGIPMVKNEYRYMNGFGRNFTGMGELTERLLELCPNLEEVIVIKEVLEGYDYGSVWQKEPDMELIERARAKAAENKKKRLEQNGEESERLAE